MKTNFALKFSSILMIIAVALSSCNSSIQIAKKRHSKGFYVSVGNNQDYVSKARPVAKNESSSAKTETITAEKTTEPDRENLASESKNKKGSVLNKATPSRSSETKLVKSVSNKKTSKLKKVLQIKGALKDGQLDVSDSDIILLLLLILAILIPPLAVFLVKGISTPFWINLILALLGYGALAILAPNIVWLGGVAAIVHAILLILGLI